MYLQMFSYVNVLVLQLADLILKINAVSRKGFFRYGKSFIKDGFLTDGKTRCYYNRMQSETKSYNIKRIYV